jgi:hypothetical protein
VGFQSPGPKIAVGITLTTGRPFFTKDSTTRWASTFACTYVSAFVRLNSCVSSIGSGVVVVPSTAELLVTTMFSIPRRRAAPSTSCVPSRAESMICFGRLLPY